MNIRIGITGLIVACFILISSLVVSSRSFAQGETTYLHLPLVINHYPVIETGKIVFESYRDGNGEIYRMNYDGAEATRLTNDGGEDISPDWSPDGSKIAFQSNRSGEDEIYVMNDDGTNPTQVTTMTHCYSPQWSPDGTRIAFYTRQNNNNIIYTMNPDGTGLIQITDPNVSGSDPYWFPDGSRIAYMSSRTTPGIYVVNVDGTNPALLVASEGLAYMALSPDGTRFALSKSSPPNYNFDIYIYNMTTSITIRITNTPYNHNSIDWSPDGYYLIFHSNREDISNFEIYTMTTIGGQITNISNNPAADSEPDWTR
jgi:Tol biopolymer transport system component